MEINSSAASFQSLSITTYIPHTYTNHNYDLFKMVKKCALTSEGDLVGEIKYNIIHNELYKILIQLYSIIF